MSGINEWLADYYGTDMTKEAEATASDDDLELWGLFKGAAAEDGIDVDELSDEDVDALAAHYLNEEAAEGVEEEDGELPPNWDENDVDNYNNLDDTEKTAFVQFKEAEFLGQVMAHSMFSEMDKVGKAGMKWVPKQFRGAARGTEFSSGRATRSAGKEELAAARKQISQAEGQLADKPGRLSSDAVKALRSERAGKLISSGKASETAALAKMRKGRGHMLAGGAKTVGLYGGTAGAIGGAGYLATKQADAIDAIAEQRALNFLKEAGVEFEGDDSPTDDEIIDQRAVEMLIENGYGELLE